MKDWREWHTAYDDPGSFLSRRLELVRSPLGDALDMVGGPSPRLLSLCAGDGRDVVPVLGARSASRNVAAVLVENDSILAEQARVVANAAGLGRLEVRCADAADPEVFHNVLPVDILMLCGIFGNVPHVEVQRLIASLSAFLVPEGLVIWTRGRSHPDRRPEVRSFFASCGLRELAFDGEPEPYGVGLNQRQVLEDGVRVLPPRRLFTFTD